MCVSVFRGEREATNCGELAGMLGCAVNDLTKAAVYRAEFIPHPENCLCCIDVQASASAHGFDAVPSASSPTDWDVR